MNKKEADAFPKVERGSWTLWTLLAIGLLTRLAGLGQPIVENYVGRQVPTAMVARNLDRDGNFLKPKLDVAPLPNLFLVEPPIFAGLVVLLCRTGLPLEEAGRIVSALGIVFGAWGLYGLTACRDGKSAGLAAVAVFLAIPVTIRYGRAFQPDALMLGCLIAGLRCWDSFERVGGVGRLVAGVGLIATGLALKVISAYVLIPLVAVLIRDRKSWKIALVAATLIPAALWYLHAWELIQGGQGSRASADNGGIWLGLLWPRAWLKMETYRNVVRFLGIRAFTPIGPPLALLGFLKWPKEGDRFWRVWGVSALAGLAVLAAKLHHEYYWLAVAPVVAVGLARVLTELIRGGSKGKAALLGLGFFGLTVFFSISTWKTPTEWLTLREASAEVREIVPVDDWVVAPEALLFEADRRGCRLELSGEAARRAAGEWGDALKGDDSAALVEFYRGKGALYFADVRPDPIDPRRLALHQAIKGRYKVLVDRPGVLIARLTGTGREDPSHGRDPGRNARDHATEGRHRP